MRRIRMFTTAAGPEGVLVGGSVVVVSDELALALAAGLYGELLDDEAPVEVEPAVKAKPRRGKPSVRSGKKATG